MKPNWQLLDEVTIAAQPGFEHQAHAWFLSRTSPLHLPSSLAGWLDKALIDACAGVMHASQPGLPTPPCISIRILVSDPSPEHATPPTNWGFFKIERVSTDRQISEFYLYLNLPERS